jgi:hypothetical protein
MGHHTKDKGDLGVAKAHADLVEQGFIVLWPATEHAPFDLVVYKNEAFIRVQVKYRASKNGRIGVAFNTSWNDRHGTHVRPVNKAEVDVVCIYCPDTDECYYVWSRDHAKVITLRISPTRNNQSLRVTMAAARRKLDPNDRPAQQTLHLSN